MSMSTDWKLAPFTKRSLIVMCVVCAVIVLFGGRVIYREPTRIFRVNTTRFHHVSLNTGTPAYDTKSEPTPLYPVRQVSNVSVNSETGRAPANHTVYVSVNVSSDLNHTAHPASFPDSYLGVLSIAEQLSANTANFVQLVYLSMLWNLSIIQPVVQRNSFMSSFPPPSSSDSIPFGYVYNMTAMAKKLKECFHMSGDFYIYSLSEVLVHASRDVLVLRFMISHMSEELEECNERSEASVKDVMKTLNSHVEKVEEQARAVHGEKYHFRPWKTICVRAFIKVPLSVMKVSSFLNDLVQKKRSETNTGVMVVIPEWRKVKNVKTTYYYYDPELAYNITPCGIDSFTHSDLVVKAAGEFFNSLHLSRPLLGVYVRTERLVLQEYTEKGFIDKCLKKFQIVLEQVKKMFNISDIALISDVGPQGSISFTSSILEKSKNILSKFKSWHINSYHYDPKSVKDFPPFRVLVASVEKEFLSQSDVLITVGSGGFSIGVASHFLVRNSADRLFTMCSNVPDYLPNIALSN